MNYKGIIFDMDGTIVATNQIWEDAIIILIKKKVKKPDKKKIQKILDATCGTGVIPCCEMIKAELKLKDSIEDLSYEYCKIGDELYSKNISFIHGFQDFFNAITKKYKLKSGVATNAPDSTVVITNKILKLDNFFGSHIYAISSVNNVAKPNPAVYLHAAKQLGLKPSECVAIDDSFAGIKAALNAGMFCIGMNASKKDDQVKEAHFSVTSYYDIDLDRLLKKKKKKTTTKKKSAKSKK